MVLLDELIHASVREGVRAGRASHGYFPHNNIGVLEEQMRRWREDGGTGRIWVAVESLYSMDGDRSPLSELTAMTGRYDAWLVVDEAHATGVFGQDGRGLSADYHPHPLLITVHTCSKAMGAAGGLICAPRVMCDFLVNRSRNFIYSTAPSPLMAVASHEALKISAEEPQRRDRLAGLIAYANQCATSHGIRASGSQILPVIVGTDGAALTYAGALARLGFDVRAVRPPTVPIGTARLRISITLNVDQRAIEQLFAAIAEMAR